MATIKNLYQDVMEGKISLEQASVVFGSQNPEVEYSPDQIEVLEMMAVETATCRDEEYFELLGNEAEAEYYNQLADIEDNGRYNE